MIGPILQRATSLCHWDFADKWTCFSLRCKLHQIAYRYLTLNWYFIFQMSKYEKLLFKVLRGVSDTNISFTDLCGLLKRFGFEERTRGSHHIFRKEGVEEKINLQKDDNKAKPYQVRQVRAIILKYRLGDKMP